MPSVVEILHAFAQNEHELAIRLVPPVGAVLERRAADARLNRLLSLAIAAAAGRKSVTDQIAYLHQLADEQDAALSRYLERLTTRACDETVSPETWAEVVSTLRAWATEIHEFAAATATAGIPSTLSGAQQ